MNRFQLLAALLLATAASAVSATTVNVQVTVGDPGYYGPIDVGGYPAPRLVYAQPVIIREVTVVRQPVYLRVPTSYARNWSSYCGRYSACDRPVYFVQDNWYNDVYAPQYRDKHAAKRAQEADKKAQKDIEKQSKDADKQAKKQAKEAEKQAKEAEKQAKKAAKG